VLGALERPPIDAGFHAAMNLRTIQPAQRRLMRAIVASVATGVALYLLVMHVVLPAVTARLTPAQIDVLRQAFAKHTVLVLGGIVCLSALLALPVLGVFRWVYGPLGSRFTAGTRVRR
jgi:hypothetical protein